jgi:hypothetical protein
VSWTIYSGIYYRAHGALWFVWLTNWGYFCVTLYFILATVVTLLYHCKEKHQTHVVMEMKDVFDGERSNPQPVASENEIPPRWHHKAIWVLYNFSANNAVLITCLYWGLIFNGTTDALDVSTHLLNTVFVLIEVFLSSIPIHLLHVVYSSCFVVVYMLFTVIYWAAGGTVIGKPYVYPYIDYESKPGLAVGLFCGCLFVGGPICQLFFFGLYKLRQFIAVKCERVD